jgi:hypothetical protein
MHNYIWCPYYLPSFIKFQIKDIAKGGLVTETTFNLDSPATLNNQYLILVRFYYSSNEYYVWGITPAKFRGSTFPGHMHNYIWCPYYLPSFIKFCSVVSEELRCLSVTQFVSATPLKLLNRISWNLVGSKDTICSCAYDQEMLIPWILWELCPDKNNRHNAPHTEKNNFLG